MAEGGRILTTWENAAYWMRVGGSFDDRMLSTLEDIDEGKVTTRYRRIFEVAFLVSMDCAIFNVETGEIAITEKGKDALEFFLAKGESG
jgi:hypothetical protein